MSATPPPPPTATEAPPPTSTGPADTAPFARSSTDRVLGGVAGALAARLGTDPIAVRIVLAVLGFVVPIVAGAYLLAWVLVARDDDPAPRLYRHVAVRDGGWLMYLLAVVLGIGIVDSLTDPFIGPGDAFPLLPLALIGIGVALWNRGDLGRSAPGGTWPRDTAVPVATAVAPTGWDAHPTTWPDPTSAPPVDTVHDPATPDTSNPGSNDVQTDTTTRPRPDQAAPTDGGPPPGGRAAQGATPPPPRPRAPRERSVLGPVTIAMALIAAGVAAALDAQPGIALDLGVTGVTAVAMLVLGLGLLVGTVWGRARWLLAVALLLLPVVGIGTAARVVDENVDVDVDLASGVGERRVTLVGDDELPDELDLLAGSIDVDLEDWRPDDAQLDELDGPGPDLRIDVGAGEVDLRLPSDVAWRVVTEVAVGEYRVRGDRTSFDTSIDDLRGWRDRDALGAEFVREGGPKGGPVLDVSVDVGFGQVTIRETAPREVDTGDASGTEESGTDASGASGADQSETTTSGTTDTTDTNGTAETGGTDTTETDGGATAAEDQEQP